MSAKLKEKEAFWFPDFNSEKKNFYENLYMDTVHRMSVIFRLLSIWKGSVLKLLLHNLALFILPYFTISALYRLVLIKAENDYYRQLFELLCIFAEKFSSLIPLTFLIGFYVSQVVTRWWNMFRDLPYPDRLALKLASYCGGEDVFKRNLRRTVMRYVNLSSILVYRLVSRNVRTRFPTMRSLVDAKLLLEPEAVRLAKIDDRLPHEMSWAPMLWALKLLQKAREQGKVVIEAPVYASLVSSFEYIDAANRSILNYGWVPFPLAYTQVATLSVYTYFFACLFGRQFLIPTGENRDVATFPELTNIAFASNGPYEKHTPDVYIPFFTIIEFVSYMGWIKVAETLLNPYGTDDQDFEINYLIDRNLQVSYMIVDQDEIELDFASDPFLEAGISIPEELPYNGATRDISSENTSGDRASLSSRKNTLRKKISTAITDYLVKDKDDSESLASTNYKPKYGFSRQSSRLSQFSLDPPGTPGPRHGSPLQVLEEVREGDGDQSAHNTIHGGGFTERRIGITSGGINNVCFQDVESFENKQLSDWVKIQTKD